MLCFVTNFLQTQTLTVKKIFVNTFTLLYLHAFPQLNFICNFICSQPINELAYVLIFNVPAYIHYIRVCGCVFVCVRACVCLFVFKTKKMGTIVYAIFHRIHKNLLCATLQISTIATLIHVPTEERALTALTHTRANALLATRTPTATPVSA